MYKMAIEITHYPWGEKRFHHPGKYEKGDGLLTFNITVPDIGLPGYDEDHKFELVCYGPGDNTASVAMDVEDMKVLKQAIDLCIERKEQGSKKLTERE